MNIYKITCDPDNFHSMLYPEDSLENNIFTHFNDGLPFTKEWKPLTMEIEKEQKQGDFLSFIYSIPVFNKKAWEILKPLIIQDVEAFPVNVEKEFFGDLGGVYYAINILALENGIDMEKSNIYRYESGRILSFDEPVFLPGKIKHRNIFRIRCENESDIEMYANQSFKDEVERNNLTGLDFKKVV